MKKLLAVVVAFAFVSPAFAEEKKAAAPAAAPAAAAPAKEEKKADAQEGRRQEGRCPGRGPTRRSPGRRSSLRFAPRCTDGSPPGGPFHLGARRRPDGSACRSAAGAGDHQRGADLAACGGRGLPMPLSRQSSPSGRPVLREIDQSVSPGLTCQTPAPGPATVGRRPQLAEAVPMAEARSSGAGGRRRGAACARAWVATRGMTSSVPGRRARGFNLGLSARTPSSDTP